jgi:predicted nucleic acid-binding protein
MELIADTTVLIDLWRFREKPSRISDLIEKVGGASLIVPWITQAEFSRGAIYKNVSMNTLASFYSSFLLLALDQRTMDRYCELWVEMARRGKAPDYPDLWIAAAACARNTPLITRNPKHFNGVPGLEVIGYTVK